MEIYDSLNSIANSLDAIVDVLTPIAKEQESLLIKARFDYEGKTKLLLVWLVPFDPRPFGNQCYILLISENERISSELVEDRTSAVLRAAHLYNLFAQKYGGN